MNDLGGTVPNRRNQTLIRLALLAVVCAGLWFLLPRPPELARLPEIIGNANLGLLGLMLLMLCGISCLRALRLHIILQSGLPFGHTFHITNIGPMANSLLPLRAGEFCMAALLARHLPGGGAEALSKLLADRLLDLLSVGAFFMATMLLIPAGHAVQGNTGTVMSTALALGGIVALLTLIIMAGPRLAELIRSLGLRLGRNLDPLAATLLAGVEGLRSLFRKGIFTRVVALSLAIWLLVALAFLTGMLMLGLPGDFACAVLAMCFTIAGLVTVPAPAGVGSTHGAIVIALTLFSIPFEQALAFAIIYHALTTGLNILLGLVGLKVLKLDFRGLKRLATTGRGGAGREPAGE